MQETGKNDEALTSLLSLLKSNSSANDSEVVVFCFSMFLVIIFRRMENRRVIPAQERRER